MRTLDCVSGRYVQYLAAVSASLSISLHGSFLGWVAPTLPQLEADDSPVAVAPEQGSWLASVNSLTMLSGIPIVALTIDRLGRKNLLLAGGLPFVAFWLMVAFAQSFEVLLAARIIGSLGAGIVVSVSPVYVAEIAEARIRGALSAVFTILMNGGNLYMMCVAPYFGVRNTAFAGLVLPALFFLTFLWMPESPYFLQLRQREEEAEQMLRRLRGNVDLKEEMENIRKSILQKQEAQGSFRDLVFNPIHRRTLLLTLALAVLQVSSGTLALITFSTEIFLRSGSSIDSNVSSIVVAAVQLVMSVASSALVDHVGRKPLMIVSFLGCAASMAAEGAYFFLADAQQADVSGLYWLPLTGLLGFQVSFALGIGAVLYVVVGEIFHVSVKGVASSLVTMFMGLTGFATKMLFQVVSDDLGTYWAFWGFAAFSLCGAVYTFALLPETKGKTFAEINEIMEDSALPQDNGLSEVVTEKK